jgi:hypothetical protein
MVHLLIDIPIRNKDKEMDFVPINSRLVQRRVRNYRDYLDYLIDSAVIVEDRQYIRFVKSKGFQFTAKFDTKTKAVVLNKRSLIKSLLEYKDIDYAVFNVNSYSPSVKKSIIENPSRNLGYITKWLNHKLTISLEDATIFLEQLRDEEKNNPEIINADRKFARRYTILLKFHKGNFLYNVDLTAGRLHTVLTQIKGELRRFIRYDGKVLVSVDIVNSQPYLATILLNSKKFTEHNILDYILKINPNYKNPNYPIMLVKKIKKVTNSKNIRLFIEKIESGTFYEYFGEKLIEQGLIEKDLDMCKVRKIAKGSIFSAFFSPNNSISYNEEMKNFKNIFPDVYDVFKLIKSTRGKHNTLAIFLQQFEAELILHTACKKIHDINPDIPIFTLHDSIITTEEYVEEVRMVMEEVLNNAIGFPPQLKIERWG